MRKLCWLSMAVLAVMGCSSDDGDQAPLEPVDPVDFIAIGEDANSVFQFTYDADSDSGQTFNLTEELGVGTNYLTLRQFDSELSFYSFANGAFSLAQIDVNTRSSVNFDDFFANSPGRSVAWGINNDTNVFFGFFGPDGSRNLAIQDVELEGAATQDTNVDMDIEFVYQPVLFENRIYFAYFDNQGNYKFTYYNTNFQAIGPILNFEEVPISFLINGEGNISIVKNGVNPVLGNYDAESLALLDSLPLNFDSAFNPGPIEGAVLQENKLYYSRPFVQPARFSSGPAIFDISTQENTALDLDGIVASIEEDSDLDIALTTQVYNPSTNMFFVGYGFLGNQVSGGVLQISSNGQLVKNIELPFFPTYLVKD